MVKINETHTAINLRRILYACLEDYKISLSQVISVTTDNGSNMTCMVKILMEPDITSALESITLGSEEQAQLIDQYPDENIEYVSNIEWCLPYFASRLLLLLICRRQSELGQ